MYVAVKGGEAAIPIRGKRSPRHGARSRRPRSRSTDREQLGLAVDRVMCEGSLYALSLPHLRSKAQGD